MDPLPIEERGATEVVHVIDADTAVSQASALLLLEEGLTVAIHASGSAFLQALGMCGPQSIACIVTEMQMPDLDGLALMHRLRAMGLHQPVIMMTARPDVAAAVQVMKAGAADLLEKPFRDEALLTAVRSAICGRLTDSLESERITLVQAIGKLTKREREVLNLLSAGKPNKVVARELAISPRTVEVHRARILQRLGVETLAEAVRFSARVPLRGELPSMSAVA